MLRIACIAFLLALAIPCILPAQWTPFLPGETHIFHHNESPLFSVQVVATTFEMPYFQRYHLNEEKLSASLLTGDPCYSNITGYDYFAERTGRFGAFARQDLFTKSIEFVFPGQQSFALIFNHPVGVPWNFNQFGGVTCTRGPSYPITVLGQPDSAITFQLSIGDSIVLSRQHGILTCPDLRTMIYYMWQPYKRFSQLVGLQNANLGLVMPQFEDIYDFQIGDEFEWYTTGNIAGGGINGFDLDRLRILGPAQISTTGDTISYLSERSAVYVNPSIPDTQYIPPYILISQFYRDPAGDIFTLLEGQSGDAKYRLRTDTSFNLQSGDLITGTIVPTFQGEFMATGCGDFYQHIWDTYNTVAYAPGLGEVYNELYSFFNTLRRMSCYRKNGILHGTCPDWTPYLTAVDQPAHTALRISPNPAQTQLSVQTTQPLLDGSTWTLTDLSGKVLRQGQCPASTTWQIQVHDLSPGIYMLHAAGSTLKVIKAH